MTTPLVTAAMIHALTALAGGERPRPGAALQAALDAFTPLLAARAARRGRASRWACWR